MGFASEEARAVANSRERELEFKKNKTEAECKELVRFELMLSLDYYERNGFPEVD